MKTYPTLEALVEDNLEAFKAGGARAYHVILSGSHVGYVLAKSPGAAALAVREVETCTPKQINAAILSTDLSRGKNLNG